MNFALIEVLKDKNSSDEEKLKNLKTYLRPSIKKDKYRVLKCIEEFKQEHYQYETILNELSSWVRDYKRSTGKGERTWKIKFESRSSTIPVLNISFEKIHFKHKIFRDGEKEPFLTIYRSHERQGLSVSQILKIHQKLPNKLTENCTEIRLSSQEFKDETPGFVNKKHPTEINILGNTKMNDMDYMITHEMAHVFDFTNGVISNSEGYITAYNDDLKKLMELMDVGDKWDLICHISEYSYNETKDALDGGKHKNTPYVEDFAECIYFLCFDQRRLHRFKSKEKYLCKMFDKPIYEPSENENYALFRI